MEVRKQYFVAIPYFYSFKSYSFKNIIKEAAEYMDSTLPSKSDMVFAKFITFLSQKNKTKTFSLNKIN